MQYLAPLVKVMNLFAVLVEYKRENQDQAALIKQLQRLVKAQTSELIGMHQQLAAIHEVLLPTSFSLAELINSSFTAEFLRGLTRFISASTIYLC